MTSSAFAEAPVRVGRQTPRVRRVPPYDYSEGPRVIAFAARAGLFLDPWQKLVLTDGLGVAADGDWTAPKCSLWVPRQNGKGGIIEALELYWLFELGEDLILHTAHELATSKKAYERMEKLCRARPFLHQRVRQYRQTNGETLIELKSGPTLEYRTRSNTGGRGFTAPKLIVDEAQETTLDQNAAIEPTLSAMPYSQVWYHGTPPKDPAAWCYNLRDDGESGQPDMAHWDWGADLDLRRAEDRARVQDLDVAYASNPAAGIRISERTILREQRPSGLGELYAQERLGVWRPRLVVAAPQWKVISKDRWAALKDAGSDIVGPVTYALAVSLDRASAAVGVCGARVDGVAHVEVVAVTGDGVVDDEGADWVLGWFVSRGIGRVVVDAKGAPGVGQDLADAGVELWTTNMDQLAAAFGKFLNACLPSVAGLRHLDQPVLADAVGAARTRALGGGSTWEQRGAAKDLTPLKAVTLAHWGHLESARPRSSSVYEERGVMTL